MPRENDPLAGIVDQVLVVSLRGGDRREDLNHHFGEMGIAFEYFDAYQGSLIDTQTLIESGAVNAVNEHWGVPFVGGEVGCYLSHVAAWIRAIGMGCSRVLICEDDVEFLYVPEFLRRSLEAAPRDADMLYLSSFRAPGSGGSHDLERRYANDYWRTASQEGEGSLAYIVNVKCMGYLLRNAFPMRYALDGLIKWPSSDWCDADLRCYISDPILCRERPCGTTIHGRQRRGHLRG